MCTMSRLSHSVFGTTLFLAAHAFGVAWLCEPSASVHEAPRARAAVFGLFVFVFVFVILFL